jgi:hypothetical protein
MILLKNWSPAGKISETNGIRKQHSGRKASGFYSGEIRLFLEFRIIDLEI